MLFTSAENAQNSMHVTCRSLSNQQLLGRTIHQNRIQLKKLEYRNYFGNCWVFLFGFFFLAVVCLGIHPAPKQKYTLLNLILITEVILSSEDKSDQKLNTVNIYINVL